MPPWVPQAENSYVLGEEEQRGSEIILGYY